MWHDVEEDMHRAEYAEDARKFVAVTGTVVMLALFLICAGLALRAGVFLQ